jgi:small subunit ribosomal protein S6e
LNIVSLLKIFSVIFINVARFSALISIRRWCYMPEFKLNIADPKAAKCTQRALAEAKSAVLMGMKVGDTVKGDDLDLAGYEFVITGGSDFCGFPMKKGIASPRKRILIQKGAGFRGGRKGMKKRKTVCGENINEKTTQINLKITKYGKEKLFEAEAAKEEKPKETKAE